MAGLFLCDVVDEAVHALNGCAVYKHTALMESSPFFTLVSSITFVVVSPNAEEQKPQDSRRHLFQGRSPCTQSSVPTRVSSNRLHLSGLPETVAGCPPIEGVLLVEVGSFLQKQQERMLTGAPVAERTTP